MKIGITGATGQLGRIAVERLKEKTASENIVALVRTLEKAEGLGVEVREFDYSKPEKLVSSLKGIDKLLLISSNEIGERSKQHANVIDAAKKAGVKFVVYTSLLHADASTLILAGEHLETENALKESGLVYTILRNGWYTENYTPSIAGAIANGALLGSSGNGKISSAARADYAKAAAVVLISSGHENKTYELAGDEAFTMSDFVAAISKLTGKNIEYKNIPVQEYADALCKSGMPEGMAQFFAGTHKSTEKGDLFDDGRQLSKLIGEATTPFSRSVAEALEQIG